MSWTALDTLDDFGRIGQSIGNTCENWTSLVTDFIQGGSSNFVSLSPISHATASPPNHPQMLNQQKSGCCRGLLSRLLCCCCCCCCSISSSSIVWCQSVTRLREVGRSGASLSPDGWGVFVQ